MLKPFPSPLPILSAAPVPGKASCAEGLSLCRGTAACALVAPLQHYHELQAHVQGHMMCVWPGARLAILNLFVFPHVACVRYKGR